MGKSMCGHLIDAGFEATVYSRTLSKCDALVRRRLCSGSIVLIDSIGHGRRIINHHHRRTDTNPSFSIRPTLQKAKGATVVDSPKAVAEQSDIVFVIVGYPSDVESVVLGPEGVLSGLKPGGVVVDWCVCVFDSSACENVGVGVDASGRNRTGPQLLPGMPSFHYHHLD